jgi:purine-binding chemotaxis protein CheW
MNVESDSSLDEIPEPTKKYLAFDSDGLTYAIDADFVNEIIMTNAITRLPKTPDFIRGVINLRGQILPIIDIRVRMGRSKTVFTDDTCVIICTINEVPIGILVDSVSQMIDVAESQISNPPLSKHQDLVDGIAKVNETVLLLISSEELMKK